MSGFGPASLHPAADIRWDASAAHVSDAALSRVFPGTPLEQAAVLGRSP